MGLLPIFSKMAELFLIIVIGYVANKAKVLNAQVKQGLTGIVLNITLPCTILSSVMNAESLPSASQIGILLLVAFLSYLLYFVIAKATSFLMRLSGKKKAVVEFALIFSNVGFIGYPVTQAIFGPDALFYTCVFNLPFNVLCYSIGVMILKAGNPKTKEQESVSMSKKMKGLLMTPAMVISLLALVMALIGWQGPAILGSLTETVGGITTPGALLIIGSALAELPIREMFNDWRAYVVSLVSVILTPLAMYFCLSPFSASDPLLLGEAVIISGMPVATCGTMLCIRYDSDEAFMAKLTFLTTLFSVVTIPLFTLVY